MTEVVCALIEKENGQLLACKRAAGTHLGGCWEFPGGKIEADESAVSALEREIAEELDIVIDVGDPLTPVVWDYGKVVIYLRPYRCRILDGEIRAHVHEEIYWCDAKQLGELDWAPADLPILAEWRSLRPE